MAGFQQSYYRSTLWDRAVAHCVFVSILTINLFYSDRSASAASKVIYYHHYISSNEGGSISADELFIVLGASLVVPGIAAYCHKEIENSPDLLSAAANWNARNEAFMIEAVNIVEAHGGLTNQQKSLLDRSALKIIRESILTSDDPKLFCSDAVELINSNVMDLNIMDDTKGIIEKMMKY